MTTPIQNIMVAVDFNEKDENLLAHAQQMAEKFNAKIWVIHIAMSDDGFIGYDAGPQYIRDLRAKDLRKEHKTLSLYAQNFNEAGIASEGLLIPGLEAETILEELAKLNIDLFMMGGYKHGFLDRLFDETDLSQLAVKSNIPLLIVP